MRAELDHLWKVERPKVTREVTIAAAHGDRSENAEYIYGKRRLREIDARVRYLAKRLDDLEIVQPPTDPPEKIFFGAWVTLEDEDGTEARYRLVGPDETDAENGCISIDSPIGRVLLGKEEGDEVTVRRPKGAANFSIAAVKYES